MLATICRLNALGTALWHQLCVDKTFLDLKIRGLIAWLGPQAEVHKQLTLQAQGTWQLPCSSLYCPVRRLTRQKWRCCSKSCTRTESMLVTQLADSSEAQDCNGITCIQKGRGPACTHHQPQSMNAR